MIKLEFESEELNQLFEQVNRIGLEKILSANGSFLPLAHVFITQGDLDRIMDLGIPINFIGINFEGVTFKCKNPSTLAFSTCRIQDCEFEDGFAVQIAMNMDTSRLANVLDSLQGVKYIDRVTVLSQDMELMPQEDLDKLVTLDTAIALSNINLEGLTFRRGELYQLCIDKCEITDIKFEDIEVQELVLLDSIPSNPNTLSNIQGLKKLSISLDNTDPNSDINNIDNIDFSNVQELEELEIQSFYAYGEQQFKGLDKLQSLKKLTISNFISDGTIEIPPSETLEELKILNTPAQMQLDNFPNLTILEGDFQLDMELMDQIESHPKFKDISGINFYAFIEDYKSPEYVKRLNEFLTQMQIKSYVPSQLYKTPSLVIESFKDLTPQILDRLYELGVTSFKISDEPYNIQYSREEIFQILSIMEDIKQSIPKGASATQKFMQVYKSLANFIDYDMSGLGDNEECSEESIIKTRSLRGALLDGKAVCVGYATTLKKCLEYIDIQSEIVVGDAGIEDDSGKHAWNQVMLYGQWFNTDLTWDYERLRAGEEMLYCLKSDREFGYHYPDEKLTKLASINFKQGKFKKGSNGSREGNLSKCDNSMDSEYIKTILKYLYSESDERNPAGEKKETVTLEDLQEIAFSVGNPQMIMQKIESATSPELKETLQDKGDNRDEY